MVFTFAVWGNLFAQISPGDLVAAHSGLEGISNCTKCHTLGKSLDNAKCLKCHTEIAGLINTNRGFHANKKVAKQNCWKCHGDHFGRKFQIIRFNKKTFNHVDAGYKLKGEHAKAGCNDCHKPEFINDKKLKNRKKTYLGLNTECKTCHEDVHQSTLGNNCAGCHTEEKFKPAVKFNHDNTNYKLTGAHKKVECRGCHTIATKNGKKFQKFNDVEYQSCKSCHEDFHKGKFGNKCSSCHTTASFRRVKNMRSFNHSKTNFPLVGKHKLVDCKTCHKGNLSFKPKYKLCTDCHSDYHEGEFQDDEDNSDCSACHTEKGFSPSTFTIEKHNNTTFRLTDAHEALPCYTCHRTGDKWHFKIDGKYCVNCHENIHQSSISEKYFSEKKCENCHNTVTWQNITFNHEQTQFKLTGKHQEQRCSACHFKRDEKSNIVQHFKDLQPYCSQCHNDVHAGQFGSGEDETCNRCHTTENWEPSLFDHNETRFSLEGAHANLECSQCHLPEKKKGVVFIRYKIEDTRCISCHS